MAGEDKRDEALNTSVGGLLDDLAEEGPAPGGGSAAALTASMAASLTASVARMSATGWGEAGGVIAQAESLRSKISPLIDLDARAYQEALDTLARRDEIAEPDRDARLQDALGRAAEIPLRIGEAAADVAELAALAAERGEAVVRADAAAAAMLAEGAARSAALLVEVNLATAEGDPRIASARELVVQAQQNRERAAAALTD